MTQRITMPQRSTLHHLFRATLALLWLAFSHSAAAQTTRYVSATGSGSGSSWANASNDLQLMITQSAAGDQVWVMAGTYKPNRPANNLGTIAAANRNNAFVLKSGVKVYGGFMGTETTIAQRNLKDPARASILSGDFNGNDTPTLTNMGENAYHVVISAGAVGTAELNGFTIQGGGYIVGTDATGSITVNGQSVSRENGGGISVKGSNPKLSDIIVRNCRANFGGGLYVEQPGGTCSITNSTFINNLAQFGGGACNYNGTFQYVNTLAYANRAFANSGDGYGGGYLNFNATVEYINATVVNNQSNRGGGMNHYNSATVTTRNSILFGNTGTVVTSNQWERQVRFDGSITVFLFNNLIQDWTGGATANLNATGVTMNDLFANPAGNDFRLKAGSVAIGAGNASFLSGVTSDIEGRPRVVGATADLGAYERSSLKKWDRGAGTDNWADAANWVPDGLPLATDSVVLDHDYLSGNYTVNLHNAATSVRSLNIDPTHGTSTILLNIPTANTVADNLRLTGTGFAALRIGEYGRITNAHGGTASSTRSIAIDGIATHGMLLDEGSYYHHNTRTSDINVLLNIDAREGSTFELQNANGGSFGFMVFPVTPAGNPFVEITELRLHHLVVSGFAHAATLANNWELYINGDLTVRNNAAFGLVRGDVDQQTRTMHLRGDINVVNTAAVPWMEYMVSAPWSPVALGWNVVFDGTEPQTINGNVSLTDRVTIDNPAGVVVNNGRLAIKDGSPSFFSNNAGLTFVNGSITTTGTGIVQVTITDPTKVTGYSADRYIKGRLERSVLGTGVYDFPVGTTTNYELATINLAGVTGTTSIVGEFRTSELGTIATPMYEQCRVYSGLLDAGFWRMTPNAALTGGTFSMSLNERGHTAVNAAYHTVVRRNNPAGAWSLQGTTEPDSDMAGIVSTSRTGLTGFTDYAIAYPATTIPPLTAGLSLGSFTCGSLENPAVEFAFSGVAPFNFVYTVNGGAPMSVTAHGSAMYAIANAPAGIYRITSLNDASGCDAEDLGVALSAGPYNNNVTVEFQTDGAPQETTWEIRTEDGSTILQSGGPLVAPNGVQTAFTCLPNGCFSLRVLDTAGDGMTTGGYILRTTGTNQRIIDNRNNFNGSFNGSVSQIAGGQGFCLPIGTDRVLHSSCDKIDWVEGRFLVIHANPVVSEQFGIANTTSGYEFWFFDPNGSYTFRRFRSHATSDGYGTGANRACHFRVNGWTNSTLTPHLPANTLLNVRVRGRVAGINLEFGPACQFKIDAVRATCPLIKLQDDLANLPDYSCGVFRAWGGPNTTANRITAAPPQPIPTVASNMVRYQFRFRVPGEGVCIVRPPQTSARLQLNWTNGTPLQCSRTYEVDVRTSLDGGITWCTGPETSSAAAACADNTPWGKVCYVTINPCAQPVAGNSHAPLQNDGTFTLYPNPNQGDQVFINLSGIDTRIKNATVEIHDIMGRHVGTDILVLQDGTLNTRIPVDDEMANGTYVVRVRVGADVYTERLVIQR